QPPAPGPGVLLDDSIGSSPPYALLACVGNVQAAITPDGNSSRIAKHRASGRAAISAEARHTGPGDGRNDPVRGYAANPTIDSIGDVHAVVRPYRQAQCSTDLRERGGAAITPEAIHPVP